MLAAPQNRVLWTYYDGMLSCNFSKVNLTTWFTLANMIPSAQAQRRQFYTRSLNGMLSFGYNEIVEIGYNFGNDALYAHLFS